MSEREIGDLTEILDRDISRRDAMKGLLGGGALLGAGKAADNVLLGYGVLVGTNLLEQDLAALSNQDFHPGGGDPTTIGGYGLVAHRNAVRFRDDGSTVATITPGDTTAADAQEIDADLGLSNVATQLARDLGAIERGKHVFEFSDVDTFAERVRNAETRPHTVSALRGFPNDVDAGSVQQFANTDPTKPVATLKGLVGGFREHAYYDIPRYAAGSIQFNVLMNTVDVRETFREPVSYEALLEGSGETGMFCGEFTQRGIDAMHVIPAHEQTIPVLATRVVDTRHRHVYLGVASVIRDEGLRVPMTFVDYTHTTLYDDLKLRGIMGEGFEAYNARHRATSIAWDPYPA